MDAHRRREPAQYYDPTSGIGRLMATRPAGPQRIGIVGLGTGTIAAFAEARDRITFYEISPVVIALAERDFTYLADARQRGATVDVIGGDGRLTLQREPPRHFDVLVLDAFSGDAVPVHLLTREAFAVYRRHLAPHGVLAVNVTNHNVDLLGVLTAAALDGGESLRIVRSTPDAARAVHASTWALLLPGDSPRLGDPPAPPPRPVVWTDEQSSLLPVLKWR
jgi:spermidine synthase